MPKDLITDHETRIRKFVFRGMPTNQWVVEVRRTWDDGHGYTGEAWRPAAPHTFPSYEEAEAYLDRRSRTENALAQLQGEE